MNVDLDISQALALEAALTKVPLRAVAAIEATTQKAAQNIKDGLVADAEGTGHAPSFAAAITYDRTFSSPTAIGYEVGPDKAKRQGALGNILYFGTSKNAPVLDLEGPVRAEEPRFLRALREAAGDAVERAL